LPTDAKKNLGILASSNDPTRLAGDPARGEARSFQPHPLNNCSKADWRKTEAELVEKIIKCQNEFWLLCCTIDGQTEYHRKNKL